MGFYDKMQVIAGKMLKGKGQTLTISRQTSGTYDPATGQASVTVTTQTGDGTIFDYDDKNIDGSLILSGDKQLFLSAVNLIAPQVNDTVTDAGGEVRTITRIKTLAPSGTVAVMFDINLRGTT